jgi:hypothetical protein
VCPGQELEGIAHVHLVVAGGVVGHDLQPDLGIAHLAHGCGAGILIEQRTEPPEELEVFRTVLVVDMSWWL